MKTDLSKHSLGRSYVYLISLVLLPRLLTCTNMSESRANYTSGLVGKREGNTSLTPTLPEKDAILKNTINPFKPFVDGQIDPYRHCSHFTTADPHAYDRHKDSLKNKLNPRLGTRAVEHLAGDSFKSMMIKHRPQEGGYSGVWDGYVTKHPRISDLSRYIATFYDLIFIMLTRETPSQEFYLQILAYRNTMLELWLTKGKSFSLRTTLLLTICSNGLALMDARFLALQGRNGRSVSRNLFAACPDEIIDILSRPARRLHKDRCGSLYSFILLQLQSIAGETDQETHFVYTVFAGTKGYLGRTSGFRSRASAALPGITARWTEHTRELHSTIQGTVLPYRKRRRYSCLNDDKSGAGLAVFTASSQHSGEICRAEAVGIALTNFPANGTEFKNLIERTRHANQSNRRSRPNGNKRNRMTMSVKMKTRKKLLTDNLDSWGAGTTYSNSGFVGNREGNASLTLALPGKDAASKNTIKNAYNKYDSINATATAKKKLQTTFMMTYKQMYHYHQRIIGPVYIYDELNLMLLLKAFSTPHFAKTLNWGRYLITNNFTADRIYRLISFTENHPTYRPRQRIITTLQRFLTNMGMPTHSTIPFKMLNSIGPAGIKKWIKDSIEATGRDDYYYKNFLRKKTRSVQVPQESWNFRLVNIQKSIREHTWQLSTGPKASTMHQGKNTSDLLRPPPGLGSESEGNSSQQKNAEEETRPLVQLAGNLKPICFSSLSSPAVPSLFRVFGNSKSQRLLHFKDQAFEQTKFCKEWLRTTGLRFYPTPPIPTSFPSKEKARNMGAGPSKSEKIVDNFRFVENLPDCVVTVEDKDPSILWISTDGSLLKHWFFQLLLVPSRWEVLALAPADVLCSYRCILGSILPRSLLPLIKDMYLDNIPYAYCTVKRKCFQEYHELTPEGFVFRGSGKGGLSESYSPVEAHTCRKANHSCVRTIVSFKKVPGRKTYKKVGRAIQQMIGCTLPGRFSLCDLSRAREDVFCKLLDQTPRPPPEDDQGHLCVGCGASMKHPTLRTNDAGQAYEVIDHSVIKKSTDELFNNFSRITKNKDPTISVMHRTKATTAVGGRIDDRLCDRTVFFASKLRICMEGLLEMRTYRIGNLFLRQAKGIPIGGPISGAILDLVLARAECRFDIFVWPKIAEKWNLAGPGVSGLLLRDM